MPQSRRQNPRRRKTGTGGQESGGCGCEPKALNHPSKVGAVWRESKRDAAKLSGSGGADFEGNIAKGKKIRKRTENRARIWSRVLFAPFLLFFQSRKPIFNP